RPDPDDAATLQGRAVARGAGGTGGGARGAGALPPRQRVVQVPELGGEPGAAVLREPPRAAGRGRVAGAGGGVTLPASRPFPRQAEQISRATAQPRQYVPARQLLVSG